MLNGAICLSYIFKGQDEGQTNKIKETSKETEWIIASLFTDQMKDSQFRQCQSHTGRLPRRQKDHTHSLLHTDKMKDTWDQGHIWRSPRRQKGHNLSAWHLTDKMKDDQKQSRPGS